MSQYDTIIVYLEKFGSGPYGDWQVSHSDKEIQTFPFISYGPIVNSFIEDFYQLCQTLPPFPNYIEFLESKGVSRLCDVVIDDLQKEEEVMALLQGYLRAERFSEGAIDAALREGHIQALLRRLKHLTVR